ncbi:MULTISPECIES: ATP-binding protein [unclassified Serratia (in: enterobacteria)]|uniref:HAMP domain-containing sensor histidine kinase n=1 Tax=unclassified Serratia (in: enterobacteria) TaxID=2647522 RepID=UPI000500F2CC|nr:MULTISPECIES: ATP-binding protein [unclassified Serratia (in: enterobacteria)]KFK95427.1 hypothetical protein JV45_08700 [Serratia sp. Ag2]KFK98775.1 hypothetical protein IV04_11405 [Serratia sp. Ag1]
MKNWTRLIIFLKFYIFFLLAVFTTYGIVDLIRVQTADYLKNRATYQVIRDMINLLETKYLSRESDDSFTKKLEQFNQLSIYTASLGKWNNLHESLTPEQYKRATQGSIIFTQGNIALKKIFGTDVVIIVNENSPHTNATINNENTFEKNALIIELSAAALLIAIFSYIWLTPIWHDVVKIREKAMLLSAGKFKTRVDNTSSDIFNPIATALNDMVDKIQEAAVMRKSMTNTMAHELRTPIARIRFHLHNYFESNNNVKKESIIDNIYNEISHVESLIETALNYASLEDYNKIISPQKQYISTWFDEKIDLFITDSEKITFIKKYNNDLGWVFMDLNLMTHVLNNLLSNAKKHTNDTIQISVSRTEEILTFSVEDNGKGISLEDYDKIFTPFYRGKGDQKANNTGFGLGLTIVYKIVALHRGKVYVRTSELGGACFVVEVPCHYQQ